MFTRPIGDRFFEGCTQLMVVEARNRHDCQGCYYGKSGRGCECNRGNAGNCMRVFRSDRKTVKFIEID